MTAAYRLKGIGWFASCVAVVIGFYLVSLQVAAERQKLDDLNGQIRAAERDIRALETEFDTRANLAQLERWNGDTLALSAPTAGQFVQSEAALAAVRFDGQPAEADVRMANMVVPSLPLPAEAPVAPAVVIQPAAPTPALVPVATPLRPSAPARLIRASTPAVPDLRPSAPARLIRASVTVAPRAAAPKPEMAMLDRKLLSDTTFGDIVSGARAEAGRRR